MSENLNFHLRKADHSDKNNIVDLLTEEESKENITILENFQQNDYSEWFNNKFLDDNYLFLIAEDESNQFIGQVRYEFKKMQAIVSISVAPDFRGLDLAAPIISKSAKYLFENNEKIEFILAYIKEINIPSIKAFEQAGYIYFQQEIINEEIFLVYRYLRN